MATTEIVQFGSGGSGSPNVLTQAAYVSYLATLTGNSFTNGATPSAQQLNKILRQPSFVAAALANALVNAGISVPDDGNVGVLAANIAKAFTTGVVGDHRNLAMSVVAASATVTLTADEIVVESALGGQAFKLALFNKTINLATTGAGGMDTGSAPVSGFVALYAIYNPTTATSALLAVNATSAAAPEVYGGANMPAGYTMSALVSVWPTNASGQFVIGNQTDRKISIGTTFIFNWGIFMPTSVVALTGMTPLNTKSIKGYLLAVVNASSANGTATFQVGKDANLTGAQFAIASADTAGASYPNSSNFNLDITNNQIYASFTNSGITGTTLLSATAYLTEYSI